MCKFILSSLLTSGKLSLKQGRLGDCWFLSAVAVLTEVSRISEVIITPEYNEEGIYTVRFCIQVMHPGLLIEKLLEMFMYFDRPSVADIV